MGCITTKRQGCCPGILPRWPHHPPFMVRGDLPILWQEEDVALCRLAAYAGDGESYLEKLLWSETAAFTECREEKGRRRERSWKNKGGKESSLPRL